MENMADSQTISAFSGMVSALINWKDQEGKMIAKIVNQAYINKVQAN